MEVATTSTLLQRPTSRSLLPRPEALLFFCFLGLRDGDLCENQPVRRVHSSRSHSAATTRPRWLRRAARNRHRHAIEQASRRWRGGRRDDSARTRRKILISTQTATLASFSASRRFDSSDLRKRSTKSRIFRRLEPVAPRPVSISYLYGNQPVRRGRMRVLSECAVKLISARRRTSAG